jgi:hypothetical protein
VTHIDISQDTWSPKGARKLLRMLRENRNIRAVDGAASLGVAPARMPGCCRNGPRPSEPPLSSIE